MHFSAERPEPRSAPRRRECDGLAAGYRPQQILFSVTVGAADAGHQRVLRDIGAADEHAGDDPGRRTEVSVELLLVGVTVVAALVFKVIGTTWLTGVRSTIGSNDSADSTAWYS